MTHIYLERHDSDKNLHRFYQMFVTPGIFGDWCKGFGLEVFPTTVGVFPPIAKPTVTGSRLVFEDCGAAQI